MKTLVLKHNGHEAHVPYELPDSFRFDCFVPEEGICKAVVDCRPEEITIIEVQRPDGTFMGVGTYLDAVYEQAGDVVRTFLEALPIEWSECKKAEDESSVAFVHRANLIESSWKASTRPSDMAILSTIAEMALLESDLRTAWCRLPEEVTFGLSAYAPTRLHRANGAPNTNLASAKTLEAFITEVLVPRVQDLATAAARRREAEWEEEQAAAKLAGYEASWMDALTKRSKERA